MRTRLRNILNYLMVLGIIVFCGAIHYSLASFSYLTWDFREWSTEGRTIFASMGMGAVALGHLLYAAELFQWIDKWTEEVDKTAEDE